MNRDRAMNVFLFFLLLSLTFVWLFPVYFSYGIAYVRTISLVERLLSLLFVLLWLAFCGYTAWKKRIPLLFGGIAYSLLTFIPGLFLPGLVKMAEGSDPSVAAGVAEFFFQRLYELTRAPLVGISVLFSSKHALGIGKLMLPILLFTYVCVQMIRGYRNAYLAEQLHLDDVAYSPNPDLARELGRMPESELAPQQERQTQVVQAGVRASAPQQDPPSPLPPAGIRQASPSEAILLGAPEEPERR